MRIIDDIGSGPDGEPVLGPLGGAGRAAGLQIDDTQEINYPAVMKAIVATGFKGHVAQEFIPKRSDKLASLKQGVQICTV